MRPHTSLLWCCGAVFRLGTARLGLLVQSVGCIRTDKERPTLTRSPTDGTIGGERDPTDGIWMTPVRRISVASADRLIRRQGWRKYPGNDGRARVFVPRTWAEPSRNGATDAPARDPTDVASDPTDISSAISALERAIIASEKRADHAENRANLAGIRAEQAESRADVLRKRVEGLLTQLATAEAGARHPASNWRRPSGERILNGNGPIAPRLRPLTSNFMDGPPLSIGRSLRLEAEERMDDQNADCRAWDRSGQEQL